MKEVKYVVQESGLIPDKVIYAGTFNSIKNGTATWKTRGDVTEQAIFAVVKHFCAKAKREGEIKKGRSYLFELLKEDFDVEIVVKRKNLKLSLEESKEASENHDPQEDA